MNKFLCFSAVMVLTSVFATSFAQAQKSDLKIFVTLTPAGDFVAKTTAIKGTAVEKADGSFTAENIEVDLNSLKTGISMRDDHMKEKYLDTKTYPKAILKKAVGKDGKGVGVLNIKGKDINVKGEYKKEGNLLISKFTLMLADTGITDVSYKGVGVDEELKVEIALPIVVAGSAVAAPAKVTPAKPKTGKK